MARPLRIEFPGATYHVTSRGNRKKKIFLSDNDRETFLNILFASLRTHNARCYAYCLMDNHFHLLIETLDGNLSSIMRDVNSPYSQKFNKANNMVGHVLQGRYKAFLIEKEAYLMEVARYIVLNPVRAKLVNHPKDWRWSSFNATTQGDDTNSRLYTKGILGFFKNNPNIDYASFVMEGLLSESPMADIHEGTILGSEEFIHSIYEKTDVHSISHEITAGDRLINRPTLTEIFDSNDDKQTRNRKIVCAREVCGYSITDISKHIHLHRTTISKIINDQNTTSHDLTPG